MDENNFPYIFEEPDKESQQDLPPQKKLERSRTDVVVAGVCSGIAKYINIDPSFIRLFALLSLLLGIWSIAAYFIAAFLIPPEYEFVELTNEAKKFQKKVNYRTIAGGILMLSGFHFGFVELGIFSSERFSIIFNGFMFPFISIVAGSYFLGTKEFSVGENLYKRHERFIRSQKDRKLLGVCGGLAEYLGIESTAVRIVFLLAALFTLGFFAIVYLLFTLTIKTEEQEIAS